MSGDVGFIRDVAEAHRQKLIERTRKVSDPNFSSGTAWAVYALDRIILACNGTTDPVELGLEPIPPTKVGVQGALFGVDGD